MFLQLSPTKHTLHPENSQIAHPIPRIITYCATMLPAPATAKYVRQLPLARVLHTLKIKFKRKGGWIRTFNSWPRVTLYKFGYGHPSLRLYNSVTRHRYKRHLAQHCIVWMYSNLPPYPNLLAIPAVKPFNCYTQRGIRTSRFFLLKRKGKESKYTHLKSKIF